MNNKTHQGWYLLAMCLSMSIGLCAQDIHFSHLAAVPTQINPAYTGLMEARARVSVDSRGQWNNFTNAFRTASLSADMKAWQQRHDVAGVGLHIVSDRAGDLSFTTTQIGLSTSYLKGLDNGKTYLSFGVQNLFSFQRIDWTEARAFSYETSELLAADGQIQFWDIGAGLSFFQRPHRNLSWFAGVAGSHLNSPTVSFINDNDANPADQLYTKWTIHAGGEIKFGRFNSFRPSIIYLHQGTHRQLKLGTFYRFKTDNGISSDAPIAVHFGAFVRSFPAQENGGVDAIILAARFDYDLTVITVSFDTNVSALVEASNGVGGPEFSVIQQFDWGSSKNKRHRVKCPTFQY